MADRESITATFDVEPGPISVADFSYFFYLFRAVYAAGVEELTSSPLPVDSMREADAFAAELKRSLREYNRLQVNRLAYAELSDDLTFLELSRHSPLSIVFGGVTVALAAAVIISGGSFQLGHLHVHLPPLGTGITALREAFGYRTKKRRAPIKRRMK
jgi:hypothetical protein